MAYYRIRIHGRGNNFRMAEITPAQAAFWKQIKHRADHGDEDAEAFMDLLRDDVNSKLIPAEARFDGFHDFDIGDVIFEGTYALVDNSTIVVTSAKDDTYLSEEYDDVWELQGGQNFYDEYDLERWGELMYGEDDETYPLSQDCPVYMKVEYEKGMFFDGIIETDATGFDPKKLDIEIIDVDGMDHISRLFYEGKEIDNWGGDTLIKSVDYYFFEREDMDSQKKLQEM